MAAAALRHGPRRGYPPAAHRDCENNAAAFSEPLRTLVSWKWPKPSIVVAVGQQRKPECGGERFTQGREQIQGGAPAGGRGDYAQAAPLQNVAVGHRRAETFVLGQHGGDVRPEIGCVVEVAMCAVDAKMYSDFLVPRRE